MKTVAFGPWEGELGWMIASWVPAVRHWAKSQVQSKTILIVPNGTEALVQDFADDIVVFTPTGKPDRWKSKGSTTKISVAVKADKWYIPDWKTYGHRKRVWHNYSTGNKVYDVCIHARAITRFNSGDRNWPVKRYEELVERLLKQYPDLKIASIGHPQGAHHIRGTSDARSTCISIAICAISMCKVVAGPSSGPMHLASHCAVPHLVWTDAKIKHPYGVPFTNRQRYEKLWNPFNTPVKVIDKFGWQPPVDYVYEKMVKFL